MKVRVHHGASDRFALIETHSNSISVRLDMAATPAESLRVEAATIRARANRMIQRASLMDEAAEQLEQP